MLDVTFKESGLTCKETVSVGFIVLERPGDDIGIGKPTLDRCGFSSDKYTIELRALGLSFAALLPSEHNDTAQCMSLVDNVTFSPPPDKSIYQTVDLVVPHDCKTGTFWMEPGPELPPELELVEGPIVNHSGRCKATFIVHGPANAHPAHKLVTYRAVCSRDEELLSLFTHRK